MILLLLLLALAAPQPAAVQTVFNDTVDIAPGQVRTLAIPLHGGARRVACSWLVHRGAAARLVLLPAADVDAWLHGKPHTVLAQSQFARSGVLAFLAAAPVDLVLILESEGGNRRPVRLRLLVRLLDPALPFPGRPLAAERRRGELVVWGSLGLFSAVAGFSAARLRRNFRRRWWGQPWA